MSYVELDIKDMKRMLSILSEYFGDKPMTDNDKTLRRKLEVMHKAELDWEEDPQINIFLFFINNMDSCPKCKKREGFTWVWSKSLTENNGYSVCNKCKAEFH